MARYTFPNGALAHAFFYQEGFGIDYGNGRNFSFNKTRIYSYSTCIGVADFDKKIFLFRSGYYSSSTSKHQSHVRHAIPYDWKVYYYNDWGNTTWYSGIEFDFNQNTYEDYFKEALNKLIKEKNKLKSGISHFGRDIYKEIVDDLTQFSIDMDCGYLLEKYLPELEVYKWTPEMLKIHKVKSWCKEAGITGSYATKLKAYENPELISEIINKNIIKKKKLEATKEERKLKAIQRSIDKWYNYESKEINFHLSNRNRHSNDPVYLRLKQSDPTMVETSYNVTVPLIECALLYRKFKQCIETNTEWHENGEKFRIGYYHINKIYNSDGWKIQAGCHLLHQEQIEEFVNKFTDWND